MLIAWMLVGLLIEVVAALNPDVPADPWAARVEDIPDTQEEEP